MNRQHARPGPHLPPETPESLSSLFLGAVALLLVAFALLVVLPVAHP